MRQVPNFLTIGIEEEYLLVDPQTRGLIIEIPENMIDECNEKLGGRVSPEFLRSQVEIGTNVCQTMDEARDELIELRSGVSEVAKTHGLEIICCSTHPFSTWRTQKHTNAERYHSLANDLQGVVNRLVICGMHVHVGVEDPDLRIDLMNQMKYFLPHLLALSTSSPFWEGDDTGLMSYRLCIWDEFPRTGLPEEFISYSDYERYTKALIETGCIEDATKIWWDIRPSARYPTIELRIADACTDVDDTLCIAAIYTCLTRKLYSLRVNNQKWRTYASGLIMENRWRAQRYGIKNGLIDFGQREIRPFKELLDELMIFIEDDAIALKCEKYVQHAYTILKRGSSAHQQVTVFNDALNSGSTKKEAFCTVVDMLIEKTIDF